MDNLLKIQNDIMHNVKQINNIISYSVVTIEKIDKYANNLNALALKWKAECKNLTNKERSDHFKTYISDFHFIHENLVGTTISTHHKNLIASFRSSHYTIFASLDIKRPIMKFKYLPTMVFTEFLKGITYFKTDNIYETPIYHRSNSCGTGSLTIREKFAKKKGYSNDDALTNIEYIRRCYLERQIYNDIFKSILYRQDIAHLKELEAIKRLYENKKPKSNLKVSVSHYEQPAYIHPTKLVIYEDYQIIPSDPNKNYYELYLKEPMSNIVRCEKGDNGKLYHKFQTFEKEMPWLEGPLDFREKNKIKPLTV